MTFKKYIDEIESKYEIFAIQEECNGRLIAMHRSFGYNEDDEEDATFIDVRSGKEVNTKNDYILYGDGDNVPTFIDSSQNVELKENSLLVTDRGGNRITLTLFVASIIPHPKE